MKKQNLKTGMLVLFKNGEVRQVMKGTNRGDILVDFTGKHTGNLVSYNEDLTYANGSNDWDINSVCDNHSDNILFGKEIEIAWIRKEEVVSNSNASNKDIDIDKVLGLIFENLFM